MYMATDNSKAETADPNSLAPALPGVLDSLFHETWTCGQCGREFGDCTSVAAHEQQCGGQLNRW